MATLTRLLCTVTFIGCLARFSHGGSVLFFMPVVPRSGVITWMPLARALAERGHEITVVSPFPVKDIPDNMDFILSKAGSFFDEFAQSSSEVLLSENITYMEIQRSMMRVMPAMLDAFERSFQDPSVLDLIHSGRKFDVTVVMAIAGEITHYVPYRLNSTMVTFFAQQNSLSFQDWSVGQPHNPAYMTFIGMPFYHPMTFMQRLTVLSGEIWYRIFRNSGYYLGRMEEILDKTFPDDPRPGRPSLTELEQSNVAMSFQFGHPLIMDGLRPLSPNYIQIGMMNCKPGKPLPQDLERFIEESGEHGVIFVSFGSVLKSSMMSDNLRKSFLTVFGQLKQRVIWKWESEEMQDQPANLMLSKWLPQPDILAHPKLKLFITHGGQSSSQEALCHKKPTVVIPVFGDQPGNAIEAERRGYGISIPIQELTTDKLLEAVNKVLHDPTYTNRAQEHGTLVLDEIVKPLDKAVWWMEYAMRYPGLKHMRSPVQDLSWYQYFLLDVIGFVLLVITLILVIVFLTCRCCYRTCCATSSRKKSKQA